MKILATLLVSFALVAACQPSTLPPEPPIVVVIGDAGTYDEPPDQSSGGYKMPACVKACATLQRLGCPDGFMKPGEDSCYVVCRRAEESKRIDLKPDCVASATTVTQVLACGTYRCR